MSIASDLQASDWLTIVSVLGGVLIGVATYVWMASQWLAKQFSTTRHLIDTKIEKLEDNILEKLEYHEKHDDVRFNSLQNNIWDIRVRNAAADGIVTIKRKDNE